MADKLVDLSGSRRTRTQTRSRVKTTSLVAVLTGAGAMLALTAFGFAWDFKNGRIQGFADPAFMDRLSGHILLQVEESGEAWYVSPVRNDWRFFLGRPTDAFQIMREHGIGISNADLAKIPVAEDSLPTIGGSIPADNASGDGDVVLRERLSGHILLQIEASGEAWYVWPETNERYYLGRPEHAFAIMRERSIGITNLDLLRVPIHSESGDPNDVLPADSDRSAVDRETPKGLDAAGGSDDPVGGILPQRGQENLDGAGILGNEASSSEQTNR